MVLKIRKKAPYTPFQEDIIEEIKTWDNDYLIFQIKGSNLPKYSDYKNITIPIYYSQLDKLKDVEKHFSQKLPLFKQIATQQPNIESIINPYLEESENKFLLPHICFKEKWEGFYEGNFIGTLISFIPTEKPKNILEQKMDKKRICNSYFPKNRILKKNY